MAIDTWDLITDGHINLKSIHIKNAKVSARVFKNGSNNFSILKSDTVKKESSSADSSFAIHLNEIHIENALVSWNDESTGTQLSATGVNFNGKEEFSENLSDVVAEVVAKNVSLTYEDDQYFFNKDIALSMMLNMDLRQKRLKIKKSKIMINAFYFDLNGDVALKPEGFSVDCKFGSPQTQFKDVLSLASFFKQNLEGIQTDGKVGFAGFVKGTYHNELDSVPRFAVNL